MGAGQHFLTSQRVLERIIDYASLTREDTVLEIGAGPGNLTSLLTEAAGQVIAIEIDPELASRIQPRENLQVIVGDALKIEFPWFDKVVSNIPYQISSPLTFKLLSCKFKLGIITYQYEFARRMTAKPGSRDYGRLSVAVQHFARAEILETLPPNAFRPRPQVTSAIVKLTPQRPSYQVIDEKFFLNFLAAVFSQRRKKLKNSIQKILKKEEKQLLLKLPQEYLEKRPEELTPQQLAELANTIHRNRQNF